MTKAPEGASGRRRGNLGEGIWCRRRNYSTAYRLLSAILRGLTWGGLGFLMLYVWFVGATNS